MSQREKNAHRTRQLHWNPPPPAQHTDMRFDNEDHQLPHNNFRTSAKYTIPHIRTAHITNVNSCGFSNPNSLSSSPHCRVSVPVCPRLDRSPEKDKQSSSLVDVIEAYANVPRGPTCRDIASSLACHGHSSNHWISMNYHCPCTPTSSALSALLK